MTLQKAAVVLAGCAAMVASGCRVDSNKHGDRNDVKIATPFGGMQVKTDDESIKRGPDLPEYPGSIMVHKDRDNGGADINMSFGSFQLRVKALSYRTSDSPEKVQAFYRNALAKYGDVIQCVSNRPVGTPTRTSQGLTCDNEKENHISVTEDVSSKFELKAGSKQHQHIVAVEQEGGGTKYGLVALDLPSHFSVGNKEESSQ